MDRGVRPGGSPLLAAGVGVGGVAVLSGLLLPLRDNVASAGPALVLVVPVVVAGVLGGRWAAVVTAAGGAVAFNVAFIPPYWTLKIHAVEDAIALAVFLVVALTMGTLVTMESERRRAVEQRAAEIAALYERLEHVTAEREELARETAKIAALKQVDEQRAALLRSVSHDLRTPLASIRAVASDLRDGAHYDEPTERELLGTVCDEAERLDRLVANLLSMSRIEAGALHPDRQAVDLEELVGECLRRLHRILGHVHLQLEFPANLPLVDGDYSQLDQVVTNLVENAARHSPAGSTIVVGAGTFDGQVELRVADQGSGVPESERQAVFEPFRRGAGSASSGVGLAICKAVTEAHGGTIAVQTTPKGGATFVVRLRARHG